MHPQQADQTEDILTQLQEAIIIHLHQVVAVMILGLVMHIQPRVADILLQHPPMELTTPHPEDTILLDQLTTPRQEDTIVQVELTIPHPEEPTHIQVRILHLVEPTPTQVHMAHHQDMAHLPTEPHHMEHLHMAHLHHTQLLLWEFQNQEACGKSFGIILQVSNLLS